MRPSEFTCMINYTVIVMSLCKFWHPVTWESLCLHTEFQSPQKNRIMYNTNANNLSDATLNTGNICRILTS